MNIKRATTLAEVCLVFLVIGILGAIIIHTIKPQKIISEKLVKTALPNVLYSLDNIIYEVSVEDETNPMSDTNCPSTASDVNGASCKFEKTCKSFAGDNGYLNIDPTVAVRCNYAQKFEDTFAATTNDFSQIHPQFVTTNGIRFFLSDWVDQQLDLTNPSSEHIKFFIIYADLAGLDRRNTLHHKMVNEESKSAPMVFAFAILNTGGVIPIGKPEVNIKYLPTYVKYLEKDATTATMKNSRAYSYAGAKNKAWGYYTAGAANPEKINSIPWTFNDVIHTIITREGNAPDSYIYKGISYPPSFSSGQLAKCQPNGGSENVYSQCPNLSFYTYH